MTQNTPQQTTESPLPLQKGRYVFIDELKEVYINDAIVPIFSAKAIIINEIDGSLSGDIETVNISDLILKQSSFLNENGSIIEAHKLYVWPRNLGSTKEWTASKQEFLNQFILNFPIQILSLQESNGVTWKYITPENFKESAENIQGSASFQEFASHKNEYFFLRQPIHSPK